MDSSDLTRLRDLIDQQRELMEQVATQQRRILTVQVEYKDLRAQSRPLLDKVGIVDPNPYADLWEWYSEWQESLPTYSSRRAHLGRLFGPFYSELDRLERRPDRKLVIALQRACVAKFDDSLWADFAYITGTEDIIHEHPRLFRSMYFGDDDYEHCVREVVEDLLIRGHEQALKEFVGFDEWLRDNEPGLFLDLYGNPQAALMDLETASDVHDVLELYRHIARIRRSIDDDPALALGAAKELLETVLKTILQEHGTGKSDDVSALLKRVRQQLDLDRDQGDPARKRLLSGLANVVSGVVELRNLYGTGHGRSKAPEPDAAHARLVVDSVAAIGVFLLEVWENQLGGTSSTPRSTDG